MRNSPCEVVLPPTISHQHARIHPIDPLRSLTSSISPFLATSFYSMLYSGALQWARQLLSRLLGPPPMPEPSFLGTLSLPAEIILMISSHLDSLSATYLALTCRYLYSRHWGRLPDLDSASKTQLLLWLEAHDAIICFCPPCLKLHHWYKHKSESILPWISTHLNDERSVYVLPWDRIPYLHARLAMNRHFLGHEHGPLPNILDIKTHTKHPGPGLRQSSARHARIVGDQLLVLRKITIYHKRGDSEYSSEYIQWNISRLCWHLCIHNTPGNFFVQVPELVIHADTSELCRPCERAVRSCSFCHTDYSINITWQGKRQGYVIELSIYRNLGSCRSRMDWSWLTMAKSTVNERFRIELGDEFGPGSVVDLWHGTGGGAGVSDAKWVD